MILVGIDIGKNKHFFSMVDKETGEIPSKPSDFKNNQEGFQFLTQTLSNYSKSNLLIGMEDTGHYHFALLKHLLDNKYIPVKSRNLKINIITLLHELELNSYKLPPVSRLFPNNVTNLSSQ